MQPDTVIHSDFPRRRWTGSDGATHESPIARRAKATGAALTDDFGVAADSPAAIADLLTALEGYAPTDPVLVIVRHRDGHDRIQVEHADHVALLTPADARLTATAIEADAAFYPGGLSVAARLREAALRVDFGQPIGSGTFTLVDDAPVPPRSAGRTMIAFGGLLLFIALMAVATGRV